MNTQNLGVTSRESGVNRVVVRSSTDDERSGTGRFSQQEQTITNSNIGIDRQRTSHCIARLFHLGVIGYVAQTHFSRSRFIVFGVDLIIAIGNAVTGRNKG